MRGGFCEGCRNNAAKIYAWLLRCNAIGGSDVYGFVAAMAGECRPALPRAAVRDAVKFSKQMRRMRDQTIADWLRITAVEAEILEAFPPATGNRAADDGAAVAPLRRQVQRQAILKRRAAVRELLAGLDAIPDVRELSALLSARGFEVSHVTLWRDLKTLGIEWERTRAATEARRLAIDNAQLTLAEGIPLYTACNDDETSPGVAR